MSDQLDGRLERALRELAEPASTDDVYERVASRHARRRTARRARTVVGGTLAAIVVVGVVLWSVGRDDSATVATGVNAGDARVVEGAAPGRELATSGRAVELRAVPLPPDVGYVRGPMLSTGAIVQAVTYERTGGGYTFPPSHVVRVREPGGRVVDRIDLQGEVLSLADGEGARWALTRDAVVAGPEDPEFRIKRLGPDGSVVSNAVPPGSVPAGDIVAAGGGVWLPVRDGVLRFDPVTGAFAARVPLDVVAEQRGIANLGKYVVVTDGKTVRRLDPSNDTAVLPAEQEIVSTDLEVLVDLATGGSAEWKLGRRTEDQGFIVYVTGVRTPPQQTAKSLPRDLEQARLRSANGVVWVEGRRDGKPVALLLASDPASVEETLALPRGRDVAFSFVDRTRAVIAVDGRLQIARL